MRGYFEQLFTTKGCRNFEHILSRVEACVSIEDNLELTRDYSKDKVWEAIKDMSLTKASRDDGLPTLFFQSYWHIVGEETSVFCLGVLNRCMALNLCNFTNIILILKIPQPVNLGNFRPISLCNVIYKIIAKMVVNCLKRVIGKCVDEA